MNPEEYTTLESIDRRHWFYQGKRAIVRSWIDRYLRLQLDDLLIDGGMGTGTWVAEMSDVCHVYGLDDHDESIALARPKVEARGGRILKTTLDRVDLPDGCATVVTLMDVLEHLDDDRTALREMIRLTKPGGLIVITVPALAWLTSDWDVALHHRRRYSASQLRELIDQPGVELLHSAYFNSLLLPAIALVRFWRRLRPLPPGAPRAENRIPPPWLNKLLYRLLVVPACLKWFRPPLGVSLLAVLRRTAVPVNERQSLSTALGSKA